MKNGVKRGKVGNQETSWEAVRENKEETTECLMERLGVDRRQKKSRCVPAHFGARSTGGPWGGGQGKTVRSRVARGPFTDAGGANN